MDNQNKTIRFSAVIDTRAFDEAIKRITQDLKEVQSRVGGRIDLSQIQATRFLSSTMGLYRPSEYVSPSMARDASITNRFIIREELETRKQIIASLRTEHEELEKMRKNMLSLLEIKKKINKESEEYKKITEQVLDLSEKIAEKENTIAGLKNASARPGYGERANWATIWNRAYEEMMVGAAGGGGGKGGFIGGAGGFFRGMFGGIGDMRRFNPLTFYGGILTGTGQLIREGADLYRELAAMPRITTEAIGMAKSREAAPALKAFSGDAYTELLNVGLLQKSSGMASEEVEKSKKAELATGIGSTLLSAGGALLGIKGLGMFGGMLAGAGGLAGSIGAGLAGVALGPLGIAAALGVGAYSLYRNRESILGYFGIGSYGEQYQAKKQAEEMAKRQSIYESLKASDPFFQYTAERYRAYQLENLPVQRALGLSDDLMTSYLYGANQRGFTDNIIRHQMMRVAAAGGSTLISPTLAMQSALLERNIGMLGAGQIYGELSYLMGGQYSKTESAMKEFLASAFKMGLDKSEYRQEFNRYNEVLSQLIQRSGITNPAGVAAISQRFSELLGGPGQITKRDIDTAADIYRGIQERTIEGGPSQVLRLASYLKDPKLKEKGFEFLSIIDRFSLEDIEAGKADYLMDEDTKRRVLAAKRGSYAPFKRMDEAITGLNVDVLKGRPEGMSEDEYRKQLDYLQTILMGGVAAGDVGAIRAIKDERAREIYIKALKGMYEPTEIMGMSEEEKARIFQDALGRDLTRGMPTGGDQQIAIQASMEKILKDNFTNFAEQLQVSSKAIEEFSEIIKKSMQKIDEEYRKMGGTRNVLGNRPDTSFINNFIPNFGPTMGPPVNGPRTE